MANLVRQARMDRTSFSICDLADDGGDKEYWLKQTPRQRLEALELLRQIHYGYDPTTERLQRVFEVVEFPAS